MSRENYATQYLTLLEKPDFWRLFIDGVRQSNGAQILDQFPQQELGYSEAQLGHLRWVQREPHSLVFLKNAAKALFTQYINDHISLDLFKKIHSMAYPYKDHLRLTGDYLFSDEPRYFTIPTEIAEHATVLAQKISTTYQVNPPWKITISKNLSDLEALWTRDTIGMMFPKLQAEYEQNLSSAKTSDQKISVIIEFLQTIEYIHPAHDGNNRVVCLLLNLALMQNDLMPTILFEPLGFETQNVAQMLNSVKKGQISFERFQKNLLPFDEAIPNEEIKQNLADTFGTYKIKPLLEGNVDYEQAKKYINHLTQYVSNAKKHDPLDSVVTRYSPTMQYI